MVDTDIAKILSLCTEEDVASVTRLPAAGGDRRYYRVCFRSGRSVVGVIADDVRDAEAFVRLSGIFARNDVPVSSVLACSEDFSCYIEEDLGDRSLFSVISSSACESFHETVALTLDSLVKMQTVPECEWEDSVAYKPFSDRQVHWDLNYFKYEFLKLSDVVFDEERLEDDFELITKKLVSVPGVLWGFQMRDCQSRNVMMAPDPVFIDYQGGRKGPCLYDAVSFLWQARAGFSGSFRQEMIDRYASSFAAKRGIDKNLVLQHVGIFTMFRTLQVLGAYGFRGLVQKRAHFIDSIPGALKNLEELLLSGELDCYPELKRVSGLIVSDNRFRRDSDGRLHVKVFSFSYKKGYPEDLSGNGGGFMFDCRGMHNPGRYECYKQLTGRDAAVIEFLRERGEADIFCEKAFELVSPSVDRYLKRGFSSLQIGFGCTGGQHRSVYCAESVARKLAAAFPEAVIEIIHREQNIKEVLE